MSECRELEPLLTSYVDGEASADEQTRVAAHLDACRPCRHLAHGERAARDVLKSRRSAVRPSASDMLKARCRAHAAAARSHSPAAIVPPTRPAPYRRWMPLTAAATIFLAVAAVFGLGLTDKASALAFQTTLDHVKCARFSMPATDADPVAAAEAWHGTFGWPIKVPPSVASDELQLRGVRRCGVLDGRVAHMMYMWNGEPLSLYVLPTAVLTETPAIMRRFGRDAVMWSDHGRTYMVVSDRPRGPALEKVIAYVRATAF